VDILHKYQKLIAQSTFITSDLKPRRRGQSQGHDFLSPKTVFDQRTPTHRQCFVCIPSFFYRN